MKATFAYILTAAVLASSSLAVDPNTITLTGIGADGITCDTILNMGGQFYAKTDDEIYTIALAVSEEGTDIGTGNAWILRQNLTPKEDNTNNQVSKIDNYFGSDPAYEGIIDFKNNILSIDNGLYPDGGKLAIDRTKTYNVYSLVGPGDIKYFENGKFLDRDRKALSDTDMSRVATNIGGSFPPDKTKAMKFYPNKCSEDKLPLDSSSGNNNRGENDITEVSRKDI